MQGQKIAECGRHMSQRAKDSLARAGHAPNSDIQRDLYDRQQEQTETENSAEGRVSSRNRRTCVDLASKAEEKNNRKPAKNTPTTTQQIGHSRNLNN
jgi:hypothetical protein